MEIETNWGVAWTPAKNEIKALTEAKGGGGYFILEPMSQIRAQQIAKQLNSETQDVLGHYHAFNIKGDSWFWKYHHKSAR